MDIRIYYEDTDSGGVVYYANYLRYFERSRTELLRSGGIDIREQIKKGTLFVVTHAEVDYKRPAKYGDLIHIESKITGIKKASFEIEYRISAQPGLTLLVMGKTTMASVNIDRKPARIGEDLMGKLNKLMGSAGA